MVKSLQQRVVLGVGGLALVFGAAVGAWWPHASALLAPLDGDYFGYAVMSLVMSAALGYGAQKALGAWLRARRRTASTIGVVAGTSERESPGHSGAVSRVVVRVDYQVSRRRFTLEWVPSHIQTSFGWLLRWVARKYPSGRELDLRYDPAEPKNAAVGRAWSAAPVAFVSLTVFGAALFLAIVEITGPLSKLWLSDAQLASLRAEAAEAMEYDPLPCTCTPAGRASQGPLQLSVAIQAGRAANTFDTFFGLHVDGSSMLRLPVSELTAPSVTIGERRLEAALACTPEALLVAQGERVSAWSLKQPHELWTTRLDRRLNIDAGPPAEQGFSLVCREVAVQGGLARFPVGGGEGILVRVTDGAVVSENAAPVSR